MIRDLVGRTLREPLSDAQTGEVIAKEGDVVTAEMLSAIKKLDKDNNFCGSICLR